MPTPPPSVTTSYSSSQVPQRRTGPYVRARKVSEFGRQLREKQKARSEYGLRETQFRRYFEGAMRSSVATGQALFMMLEGRLDNVLYRTGIAKTRRMARQLVGHGLVLVNGKRISMPSYPVSQGDAISLKNPDTFEYNKDVIIPDWLSYNNAKKTAKVERLPKADDIVTDINPQLIIEFYSR